MTLMLEEGSLAQSNDLTEGRRPLRPKTIIGLLFFVGSFGPLLYILRDGMLLDGTHLRTVGGLVGRDFSNLYAGGKLVWAGQTSALYDLGPYRQWLEHALGITQEQNYSYPPPTLYLGALLATLPYPFALIVWTLGSILAFSLSAKPWVRFNPMLAALSPAALVCIYAGQYGLLIGALWLMTFRAIDRPAGGIFAGLMTIKPHLGAVLALVMLRRPIAIAVALCVAASLIASSALAFPGLWPAYFENVPKTQAAIMTDPRPLFYFRMMVSAYAEFRTHAFALPLQLAVSGIALWIARPMVQLPLKDLCFPAATLTFIVLPYAFCYDMTVACLGFAALLHDHWTKLSGAKKFVVSLAFFSPTIALAEIPVFPLIVAAFWIQVSAAVEQRRG